MSGVSYNVEKLKQYLGQLLETYGSELAALPDYESSRKLGFGPGYTEVDAMVLYMMIRDAKPRQYLEVGSGLSTYYCSLAAKNNSDVDHSLEIRCIEPFPYDRLYSIPDIEVSRAFVQDVGLEQFQRLEADDVLFLDSSHVLRIDGDVPFLYLEVLPTLQKGVLVHIHDIPFPYNVPYPPDQWILGRTNSAPYWPMFWNEAMVLQAFLAFNPAFEIVMSAPLIRHHDEAFLSAMVPGYRPIDEEPNTFSSIWLRKTA